MENVDIAAEVAKVEELITLDPYSDWYDDDTAWTNGAKSAGVQAVTEKEE